MPAPPSRLKPCPSALRHEKCGFGSTLTVLVRRDPLDPIGKPLAPVEPATEPAPVTQIALLLSGLRASVAESGETGTQTREWIWVTTLPSAVVPTASVVHWGHARWDIENYGFNELVHGWHADHVYKHDPNAIEAFLLTVFLAYNLFHAWLTRNLQPSIQRGRTQVFWARLMAAEIYGAVAIRSP